MKTTLKQRIWAVLLAIAIIVPMLPVMSTHVHAANENEPSGKLSVSNLEVTYLGVSGSGSCKLSGTTVTATAKSKSGLITTAGKTRVTFTNKGSSTATLSFNYSGTDVASLTVDGTGSDSLAGFVTKALSAGDTSVIEFTSQKGGLISSSTATLTITDVALSAEKDVTVSFKAPTNGSYTVDGNAVGASGYSATKKSTESFAVEATPASGYAFFGWYNETTGTYLSYKASDSLTITDNATVYPEFVPNTAALFDVGGTRFSDLTKAGQYAASGAVKTIVLLNNGTLRGEHTIPAGVTLLIPFNDSNTLYTNEPACTSSLGNNVAWVKPTAYRTLTMAADAKITVNGAMSLSAKHAAANGGANYCGSPTGPVSFVTMQEGANITVNNGGKLYVWGFITGSGSVTANSGATVYENFQITDFRGGSATMAYANNGLAFPLNQYYVQNIEVPVTFHAGASEKIYTSAYSSGLLLGGEATFIGNGGMFTSNAGGYVVKDFDESCDRLIVDMYGSCELNSMTVELSIEVNSANYLLPITNNVSINIHSGTTTLKQSVALLPGVEVTVDKGATLNLAYSNTAINDYCAKGYNIIVYDRDEWFYGLSLDEETMGEEVTGVKYGNVLHSNATVPNGYTKKPSYFAPVLYAPGRTGGRTDADLKDAVLNINGTLEANGFVYTTIGGASIISSKKTGTIKMKAGAGLDMITCQNNGTTSVTLALMISSACLQNGDGSYLQTKVFDEETGDVVYAAEPDTIYNYCATHDCWYTDECEACNSAPAAVEITWIVGDSETKQEFENGATPIYNNGTNPTKAPDVNGHYTFAGWATTEGGTVLPTLSPATANATYYAVFTQTAHADTDKVASDGKHYCDSCGYIVYSCKDNTADHVCDYGCGSVMGEHKSNAAHPCQAGKCDYCQADMPATASHTPAADDGDCATAIKCTVCGAETTAAKTHVDGNDKNHKCDNDGCNVDDVDGGCNKADDGDCTTAVICSECDKVVKAATTHDYTYSDNKDGATHGMRCDNAGCDKNDVNNAPHTDGDDQDHKCDDCQGNITGETCVDTDKDHKCDECGETTSTCVDVDKNHECDYEGCKAGMGEHKSNAAHPCQAGKCDYCQADMPATASHTPAADDGDCTTAITCTVCGAETTAAKTHVDGNDKNHKCDNDGCNVDDVDGGCNKADDGDCTTAVVCSECDKVVKAATTHDLKYDNMGEKHNVRCENPGCDNYDANNAPHDYKFDDETKQYVCICHAVEEIELPEVEVSNKKNGLTGEDPDLTFALNFAIKDLENLSEAYLEKVLNVYGHFYADYVLTISGLNDTDVTFNADGNADGYLAGQYDAWSENWVTVPFENVTVSNGESLYIMEYAAELMHKQGLRFTLAEVAAIVQDFDCGVYFTPEFLAANPGLKVTLELKLFKEDANGNKTNNISVATNVFEVSDIAAIVIGDGKQTEYYESFTDAYNGAEAGDTIVMLKDATLTGKLTVAKNITIDGNGHRIIADANTIWHTVSGKLQVKNYHPWVILNKNGITLKDVIIDSNSVAGGVKIENAENVVFDDVSIVGAKADAITVVGSSLSLKTYLKVETSSSVIDARSGVVTAEPGTVFDMMKFTGSVSPSKSDLKGVVDVNGAPFFCAYNTTGYFTSISSSTPLSYNGLVLLKDVTLTFNKTLSSDSINLNGHTLTVADGKVLTVSGNASVNNGSVVGEIVLSKATATLAGSANLDVTTSIVGHEVKYESGVYSVVPVNYTISWDTDGDGVADATTSVAYGTVPTAPNASKAADANFTYTFNGWDREIVAATGAATYTATFTKTGWNGKTYLVEDEVQKTGWTEINGTWYYLDVETGIRKEGTDRVPYPTVEIDGNKYAPEDTDSEFKDSEKAWFIFDSDGKFLSNVTGLVDNGERYAHNGMIPWHYGLATDGTDYYYFIGDAENGGNKLACGNIYMIRPNGLTINGKDVHEKACYTFDDNGKLCLYEGVVRGSDGALRYYYDYSYTTKTGLIKVNDKYIYVSSSTAKLIVDAERWVVAEGLVAGMYKFGADGYLINPASTEKNGIFLENGKYCYYVDGAKAYAGLIKYTGTASDGTVYDDVYIYVRSNGELAVGGYWITKTNGLLEDKPYNFNEFGVMDMRDGIVSENGSLYYYKDGVLQEGAGLIKIGENYYYVRSSGEVVNNRSYWISNTNDYAVVAKNYSFDANGVMQNVEVKNETLNGVVDGYYYENGNLMCGLGPVEWEGNVYYVRSNGQVATGQYWTTVENELLSSAIHIFDATGKLVK